MGRKKIEIKRIESDGYRRATFEKRRIGLLKKAMELSILCDCEISVTIKPRDDKSNNDYYIYSSDTYDKVIKSYQEYKGQYTLLTNNHVNDLIPGKVSSRSIGHKINKTKVISSKNGNNNTFAPLFPSIPMNVPPKLSYLPPSDIPPELIKFDTPSFKKLFAGLNKKQDLPPKIDMSFISSIPQQTIKTENVNNIENKKRPISMIKQEPQCDNEPNLESLNLNEPPTKKVKINDGHNFNKINISDLMKKEE